MPRPHETEFLNEALQGRREAVFLCQTLFRLSQVIDDLHDADKPVTKEQIHRMAWEALVELPSNAFYQQHFAALQPLIRGWLADWMDSCLLEQGDDHGKHMAFVLRDSIGAVVIHCAYLIGGYDWMRKVAVPVRQHIFEESLEAYMSELKDGAK